MESERLMHRSLLAYIANANHKVPVKRRERESDSLFEESNVPYQHGVERLVIFEIDCGVHRISYMMYLAE